MAGWTDLLNRYVGEPLGVVKTVSRGGNGGGSWGPGDTGNSRGSWVSDMFNRVGRTTLAAGREAARRQEQAKADKVSPFSRAFQDARDYANHLAALFGPDQGRGGLASARTRVQDRMGDLQSQYARAQSELGRLFNLGEDPNERARYNYAREHLANQFAAAIPSIDQAFQQGIAGQRQAATGAREAGRTSGAELAALFTAAADTVNAENAALAEGYADTYGAVGGGGAVTGAATDLAAELAAAAPREQAAAMANAENWAGLNESLAASMVGYNASEQAAAHRDRAMMEAELASMFAQREAERVAREREAWRAAQMDLANRYASYGQDLANREDELLLQLDTYEDPNQAMARQFFGDVAMSDYVDRRDRERVGATAVSIPGLDRLARTEQVVWETPDENGLLVPQREFGWRLAVALEAALGAAAQESDPRAARVAYQQALAAQGIGPDAIAAIENQFGIKVSPYVSLGG